MPKTKINKAEIWAQLLEVIGSGIEITSVLPNGLTTGNKYSVVKENKILIEALGFFGGSHKTLDINAMSIKRIQNLTKILTGEGGEEWQ